MSNELGLTLLTAGLFFLLGIISQIIGSTYSDKLNGKRNLDRLSKSHSYKIKYLKEKEFFWNKLKYFEKLSNLIEGICYDYTQLIVLSPTGMEFLKQFSGNVIKNSDKKQINQRLISILKKLSNENNLTFFLPQGKSIYLDPSKGTPLLDKFVLNHTQVLVQIANSKKHEISEEVILRLQENLQIGQNLLKQFYEEMKP